MSIINEQFGKAVNDLIVSRGLSNRSVMIKTGIDYNTVNNMRHGMVTKRGVVISFAQGLGEPINKWLELAGYDPIPPELIQKREVPPGYEKIVAELRKIPNIEERIPIAFGYIHRVLKIKCGSSEFASIPLESMRGIIEMWEGMTGLRLLDVDVQNS